MRRGRKRGRGGLWYHSRVSLRSCQAGCVCLFHYCSSTAHHYWHLLRAEEPLDFPLSQKGLVKVTHPYCSLTPSASLLLSGHLLFSHSDFVFFIFSLVLAIFYVFKTKCNIHIHCLSLLFMCCSLEAVNLSVIASLDFILLSIILFSGGSSSRIPSLHLTSSPGYVSSALTLSSPQH